MEFLIGFIAIVGCISALHSWVRIAEEKKRLIEAEAKLTAEFSWIDAYPNNKEDLDVWLRQNQIRQDSHLGDFIRACWSAWLGGRPASLTELHALVSRRERSLKATRLSAGIAAMLLVCGILGTLWSVKPVLEKFQLNVAEDVMDASALDPGQEDPASEKIDKLEAQDPDQDSALVAENANKVNTLIKNLGGAFHPSLWALLGTIVVVSCRGIYGLSLHQFTLDLDRFAVDVLIPRYRVPSMSDQYKEVKEILADVAQSMNQREERFLLVVEQLESIVTGISPAVSGLHTAADAAKESALSLSTGVASITEALNANLGAKSPIHRAVKGLDSVYEKTEQSLNAFSMLVKEIGEATADNNVQLKKSLENLGQSIQKIGIDHIARQAEVTATIDNLKNRLSDVPNAIEATSQKAVNVGLATVKDTIAHWREEQLKSQQSNVEVFRSSTSAGVEAVTKAGQDLKKQAEQVIAVAKSIQEIKSEVSTAIKDLAQASKSEILRVANSTPAQSLSESQISPRISPSSISPIGSAKWGSNNPSAPSIQLPKLTEVSIAVSTENSSMPKIGERSAMPTELDAKSEEELPKPESLSPVSENTPFVGSNLTDDSSVDQPTNHGDSGPNIAVDPILLPSITMPSNVHIDEFVEPPEIEQKRSWWEIFSSKK